MRKKFISILFVSIIILGSITALICPKNDFSKTENRRLQTFPKFNINRLIKGDFIKEFESFTIDQFPKRNLWVAVKTYGDIAIGKKDNGKVYFGKNDMLFSMENIDEKQQKKNVEMIDIMFGNIKRENPDINIFMLLAPMSPDIYPENMPEYVNLSVINQVNDVFEDMATKNNVKYIKIYEEIKKAKKNNRLLYYRTDHHWTTEGARIAAEKFRAANDFSPKTVKDYKVIKVSDKFYGTHQSKTNLKNISPDNIFRYEDKNIREVLLSRTEPGAKNADQYEDLYFDKFLYKKDKYSYFLGGNSARIDIVKNNMNSMKSSANLKTLLVIRDSFANCFIPFLVDDYDRIIAIDFRYFRGSLKQLVNKENVTDVLMLYNIIQISNDRNLVYGMM